MLHAAFVFLMLEAAQHGLWLMPLTLNRSLCGTFTGRTGVLPDGLPRLDLSASSEAL